MVQPIKHLLYEDRLQALKFSSVKKRLIRRDVIPVHQLTHRLLDVDLFCYFTYTGSTCGQGCGLVCLTSRLKFATFYHEHVLTKEPGTLKKTPWHHDQSYYPIDGFKVCSIWMPIDPIPLPTTLRFVKGSHKWGRWFMPRKFKTNQEYSLEHPCTPERNYEHVPDIDGNSNQYQILAWEMKPGDCVVFHMKTLHGAAGNLSTTNHRRILSTRWVGDDAVFATRPWIPSPPIDGELRAGEPISKSNSFPTVWRTKKNIV